MFAVRGQRYGATEEFAHSCASRSGAVD